MASLPMNWEWKVEPVSPGFISADYESDPWLFEDDAAQLSPSSVVDRKPFQPTRAEVASKLLEDLDTWIKEEPFSDWLEEKIDLPIFEDLPTVEPRAYGNFVRGNNEAVKPLFAVEVKNVTTPQHLVVANDTQTLLQEFESVFGEVELNNGTLTPPQSPTLSSYPNILTQDTNGGQLLITTLQQMVPVHTLPTINSTPIKVTPIVPHVPITFHGKKEPILNSLEQLVPVTPVPDLAQELAVVDELIRTRVEDLETSGPVSSPWEVADNISSSNISGDSESELSSSSPHSPWTSSNSSFESGEEFCDDPEWIPVSVQSPAPGSVKTSGRKRGSKPYARTGTEEKRMRKKEQNKNAATRYRQKKKAEVEVIIGEEKGLEDINSELHQKVSDLAREIKYLKGLMRDVFKAKGLIK